MVSLLVSTETINVQQRNETEQVLSYTDLEIVRNNHRVPKLMISFIIFFYAYCQLPFEQYLSFKINICTYSDIVFCVSKPQFFVIIKLMNSF